MRCPPPFSFHPSLLLSVPPDLLPPFFLVWLRFSQGEQDLQSASSSSPSALLLLLVIKFLCSLPARVGDGEGPGGQVNVLGGVAREEGGVGLGAGEGREGSGLLGNEPNRKGGVNALVI